ncbi:cache domain-containing protein, partial [Rhodoplanes sp. SY1]|uniref:cache domain-containing protein n=1 Tax=Rhodoplanes sp. SY1 TaxID=3166646 RepID=UPI0038B57DDF
MLRNLRLTIGVKIFALVGLGFLGLVGSAALGVRELASGLTDQKRIELQHLAELALSIARDEHAAAERGAVPADDAKATALRRIAALRYDGNEYFFVTDLQARILAHGVSANLVGKDMSDSRDPNGKRLVGEIVDAVRKNGSGFVDYVWAKPGVAEPQPKLSYAIGFSPWGWAIVTGVYIDDLDRQIASATRELLLVGFVVLLVTLAVSAVVARRITKPLQNMTATMKELSSGKLDVEVPGIGRRDEIGDMAGAVAVFKASAIENKRLEAEQKDAEARAAAQRRADMHRLADQFEAAVGGIIATVSSSANELEATATTLTRTADMTQGLSSTVSSASEEASTNVQAVAAATNEMTSSIGEISRQVQTSSRISDNAVRQAEKTDARVGELSQAANRIGDVVKLITAIAEQTNLLALNATIEAA